MKERKKSSFLDSEYLLARRPISDDATPEDDEGDSAISAGPPSVIEREEDEVDLDAIWQSFAPTRRYSLPWDGIPFSGFWRLDHRSLEATTCGGTISTATLCSGAGRHVLLPDITTLSLKLRASNKPLFKNTTRQRVKQPPSPSTTAASFRTNAMHATYAVYSCSEWTTRPSLVRKVQVVSGLCRNNAYQASALQAV
ncbi:hypothetical protein ARMGADRAFT_1091726 [Armillaria gallica]|uniref:Uncharacterized protein n=1 Tax=Armillaria gallica TaxID=47427 RepID=A0A2H3CHY9_ARMGA|nr:hypothetical protein ARMGADRAFT_1091726 [Armillaria gallica]